MGINTGKISISVLLLLRDWGEFPSSGEHASFFFCNHSTIFWCAWGIPVAFSLFRSVADFILPSCALKFNWVRRSSQWTEVWSDYRGQPQQDLRQVQHTVHDTLPRYSVEHKRLPVEWVWVTVIHLYWLLSFKRLPTFSPCEAAFRNVSRIPKLSLFLVYHKISPTVFYSFSNV